MNYALPGNVNARHISKGHPEFFEIDFGVAFDERVHDLVEFAMLLDERRKIVIDVRFKQLSGRDGTTFRIGVTHVAARLRRFESDDRVAIFLIGDIYWHCLLLACLFYFPAVWFSGEQLFALESPLSQLEKPREPSRGVRFEAETIDIQ
jgi:hypothetical protein